MDEYLFITPGVEDIPVNKAEFLLSWKWHSWSRVGEEGAGN